MGNPADNRKSLGAIIAAVAQTEKSGIVHGEELRISILRNYTVDSLVPLLKYYCHASSLQPVITMGDYDNIRQEILDETSHIYTERPHIIVVSVLLEHLDPACSRHDWTPAVARETLFGALEELLRRTSAMVVLNTVLAPLSAENSLGIVRQAGHRISGVQALNASIREFCHSHSDQVFVADWERMLQCTGEEQALDYRFWYMYRAPFRKDFLAHYARYIVKVGRALKGRASKCLILDCDNTLWGGVVGEEGIGGIQLDRNEYPGRCYYDFQQTVLNLISQGVIVALCSKNNEEDVWEVLDTHPHCLLKRHHLAAWRINWQNKADNIGSLAAELNLGLDSMVFVDDSSIECQTVRDFRPEVTVVQTPELLYELPRLLFGLDLFDTLTVGAEDQHRTQMYAAERERVQLREQVQSIDDYLTTLELQTEIQEAAEEDLPRVAQLIGKTNQFNLTTQRYTEGQVREFAASTDSRVFTMRAGDRFGDLGLVAVLIARRDGSEGTIDSLLMSCRALGRKLEITFVDRCLAALEKAWEVSAWRAEYRRSAKNAQVECFWDSLGFLPEKQTIESKFYVLPVSQRRRPDHNIIDHSNQKHLWKTQSNA